MNNKKLYTEENIKKLINSSLENKNQLDTRHKKVVLEMLLQELTTQKKKSYSNPVSIIWLSMIWLIITFFVFCEFNNSQFIITLIKAALGISILFIPISSIILIILKLKTNGNKTI